jgi:cytochrome c oxidase assembly protein subunit 15
MASADTAIGRLRLGAVSSRALERSAWITLGLLWLVVTTGGLVRLTASGLGCTDWPNCAPGSLIPAGTYHAVIEYSNRIISGVGVVATVVTAVLAQRSPGAPAMLRRVAWAAAAGTVAQAPLGAITVATDLNPFAVMSHFLLAMAVLAASAWVAYRAWRLAAVAVDDVAARRGRVPLAWAAVVAALGLVTTGAFVTAAGPHPGSSDKPIDRLWNFHDAAWLHVRVAVTFSVLFLTLAVWLWRRDRGSLAQRLSLAGIGLTLCQLAVGEYQYRNDLPWQAIAVHVAIAATLVVTVVLVASLVTDSRSDPPNGGGRQPSGGEN